MVKAGEEGGGEAGGFEDSASPLSRIPASPLCIRCGFPVQKRMAGCKNPCSNCGTIYPLGDCSD